MHYQFDTRGHCRLTTNWHCRLTTDWQPTLRSFISHFRIESISFPRSTLFDASLLSSMPIIERFKPVYECWNDAPLTNHTLAQTKHSYSHNPHSGQRWHVFHIYSSLSRWPSLNSPQLTHIGMMYLAWSPDIICLTKACTQFFTHSLNDCTSLVCMNAQFAHF